MRDCPSWRRDAPLWEKTIVCLHGIKQGIHVVLLMSFMLVAATMLGLFFKALFKVVSHPSETGILHAFGTLLVLWTVTELIHAELSVLGGHKFGVAVLLDVAIAALVRKMLISDFSGGAALVYGLVALVVLAVVRILITTTSQGSKTKAAKKAKQTESLPDLQH